MDMQDDHALEEVYEFMDWLGGWLGANDTNHLPAYQAPNDGDPPGPDRYLFRNSEPHKAIWICSGTDSLQHGLQATIARLQSAVNKHPELRNYSLVVASPDDLGDIQLDGIEVLDAKTWMATWEAHRSWSYGIGNRLKRWIIQLPTGGEEKAAQAFQALVMDVFLFLFWPSLCSPHPESYTLLRTQRRDLLLSISWESSVWRDLAIKHQAGNVVIEAKNYRDLAGIEDVRQVRDYLQPHAPGHLGVLATRYGLKPNAVKDVKRHATQGIAILPIDGTNMVEMIDAEVSKRYGKSYGGASEVIAEIYGHVFSG